MFPKISMCTLMGINVIVTKIILWLFIIWILFLMNVHHTRGEIMLTEFINRLLNTIEPTRRDRK